MRAKSSLQRRRSNALIGAFASSPRAVFRRWAETTSASCIRRDCGEERCSPRRRMKRLCDAGSSTAEQSRVFAGEFYINAALVHPGPTTTNRELGPAFRLRTNMQDTEYVLVPADGGRVEMTLSPNGRRTEREVRKQGNGGGCHSPQTERPS